MEVWAHSSCVALYPSIIILSLIILFNSLRCIHRSLTFDVFLWGFICWYCNRVIPGDYGHSLEWNFFIKRSYWCGTKEGQVVAENEGGSSLSPNQLVPNEEVSAALMEQENEGRGVHVRGLTKQFGDKMAVDNLNLSMYTGQVFALLGHNGAGKQSSC